MTFLNPWMIFGLLGVSVPILVHLLNRFRPRRIDWGAMELLRRAMVSRSRQVKLEDLLLLLLRCAAIALIASAMARPTLTGPGGASLGSGATGAVIALDGSMSMGHQPGMHRRLDRAVETVREILATLEPGAPLAVVLLGDQPQVLQHGRYHPQELEKILADLEPGPERLNLPRSLELVEEQLDLLEAASLECYLVTDTQAVHWAEPSAPVRDRLASIGQRAALLLVPVADPRHENLAIESLEFVGGALCVGATARYRAEVRNTGSAPQFGVSVQLLCDDVPVDVRVIEHIDPGQTGEASFLLPMERAGIRQLAARLESDAMPADNLRYVVADVREQVRVLVVSGRSAPHWSEDAGGFVVRAIQARQEMIARGSLPVQSIDWMELPRQSVADYDLIVLADVPDLADPQVESLRRFVEGGGGLVLIAGEQIDPPLFNARLASGDRPLAPARLLERQTEADVPAEGVPLRVADARHPLARPLAPLSADLLDEARVRRYVSCAPLPGARVVLALADATESPLLVEHSLGRGRVLLWTTGADRAAGDLVIHPAWLIVWQLTITALTQPEAEGHLVGQPLAVALPSEGAVQRVRFDGPRDHPVISTPAQRQGRPVAELPRAAWPGFYRIYVESGDANGTDLAQFAVRAVNVDTGESDVRVLDPAALAAAWGGFPGTIVDPAMPLAEAIRRVRLGIELWRPLLALGLLALVLEAWLARRFTRRMGLPAASLQDTRDRC